MSDVCVWTGYQGECAKRSWLRGRLAQVTGEVKAQPSREPLDGADTLMADAAQTLGDFRSALACAQQFRVYSKGRMGRGG